TTRISRSRQSPATVTSSSTSEMISLLSGYLSPRDRPSQRRGEIGLLIRHEPEAESLRLDLDLEIRDPRPEVERKLRLGVESRRDLLFRRRLARSGFLVMLAFREDHDLVHAGNQAVAARDREPPIFDHVSCRFRTVAVSRTLVRLKVD